MDFVDTHCHIHFADYPLDKVEVIERANQAGVQKMIVVGTTLADSQVAADFAAANDQVYAAVGVHPHEVADFLDDKESKSRLDELLNESSFIAVGEIGLDYYKNHSPREAQLELLTAFLEATKKLDLPYIFHVRDAWEDFWQIYDEFGGPRGVVHSFTSGRKQLSKALERGLYVGLNGIMTFTKDESQLEAAKRLPLERLMLETDAPFLTPVPHRGEVCEPKHVVDTAKFLAKLRNEDIEKIAAATTANAEGLFGI